MPRPDCLVALRKVDAGLIGGGFLVLAVGEQAAHGGILAAIGDPHAGLSDAGGAAKRARRHGGEAEQSAA